MASINQIPREMQIVREISDTVNYSGMPRRISPFGNRIEDDSIRAASLEFITPVLNETDLNVYERIQGIPTIDANLIERILEDPEKKNELYKAISGQNGNEAMEILVKYCTRLELNNIYRVIYPNNGTSFSEGVWEIVNFALIFDGVVGGDTTGALEAFRNVISFLVKDRLAAECVELSQSISPGLIPSHQPLLLELSSEAVARDSNLEEAVAARLEESKSKLRELEFYRSLKWVLSGGTTLGIMVFIAKNPEYLEVLKNFFKTAADVRIEPGASSNSLVVTSEEPTTLIVLTRAYTVFLKYCLKCLSEKS